MKRKASSELCVGSTPKKAQLNYNQKATNKNKKRQLSKECVVNKVEDNGFFFILFRDESFQQIEQIMTEYNGLRIDQKVLTDKTTGAICAAKSNDGTWRRAKILGNITPALFEVRYIDFGETAAVDYKAIKELGEELKDMEHQSMRYHMTQMLSDAWDQNKFQETKEVILKNQLIFELLDAGTSSYTIKQIPEGRRSECQVAGNVITGDKRPPSQAAHSDMNGASSRQQSTHEINKKQNSFDPNSFSQLNETELLEVLSMKLHLDINAPKKDILLKAITCVEEFNLTKGK